MKKLKKIGIGFGILLAVGAVGSIFSEEEKTEEVVAEQEVSEKEISEKEETERKEFEEVMEEVQEQRDKKEEELEAEKEKELAKKEEELKKKEEELAKIEEEKAKEKEKENKEKELVEKEEQVLSILEENFDQFGKVEFNKEHKNYTIIPTDPNLVSEINLIATGVFPEDWDNMVESFVELSNSLTNQLGSEYSVSLTNPANHENILILVRNGVLLYDVQNDL